MESVHFKLGHFVRTQLDMTLDNTVPVDPIHHMQPESDQTIQLIDHLWDTLGQEISIDKRPT